MRSIVIGWLSLFVLAAAPGPAAAVVHAGDPAPAFTKTALDGGPISLSDYSGKVVVLFLLGYG